MSKARDILQEWANELLPLFDMPRVGIGVQFHELFEKERDRIAFSTKDAIFVNPNKILSLTNEFKHIIKWEMVWVWAARNNVAPNSPEFKAKARSVGL